MTITTTILVLKGFLAFLFLFTGMIKMVLPKTSLLEKGMKGLTDLNDQQIKVIGFLEVMGACGLILPTLLDVYPVISSVAALCLGLTMIVAVGIHYRRKLSIIPNITVFVMCMIVAFWQLI